MSEDRKLVAEVLLDQNLDKPLDYEIPTSLLSNIRTGLRVTVPVRQTIKKGTISCLKEGSLRTLRPLSSILPEEYSLPEPLWQLALWMSRYYCCPLQRVLKCLTPPSIRKEIRPKTVLQVCLAISQRDAIDLCSHLRAKHLSQAQVLDAVLGAKRPWILSQLMESLKISRAPITSLVKNRALKLETAIEDLSMDAADFFPTKSKILTSEQTECLAAIRQSIEGERFATHLIYGVTGSGKTEIYLQAIQQTLDRGKSAILLVPEIALTSQTIERFRSRFGMKLAILHHRKSFGERTAAWESLRSGDVKIAIGARSAIFCPAQNVGLIIIDEEHDSSYKQSEEPSYHARNVALMRAKIENAVVVLGSATPSLESYYNANSGKYHLSKLLNRATEAKIPEVHIIDMKQAFEKAGGFTHFSQELLDGIKDRTEKGEQILLLLNRRGFHRMQLCSECRHIAKCPHCDLSLTFHREANELRCHLCNYQSPPLHTCPICHSRSALEFHGFGTEHVERSLHAVFPDIRTLRMDRDTTSKKDSHEDLFRQFRAHKADVLIGTQMIAKGFHFPSVTLVGVLNADSALQIPDYRSSETVFQLLTQVAGRSGRAELPGEVILQTFLPKHPMLQLAAKQDYPAFYERELEERRLFSFPPFCRLIKLVLMGQDEKLTSQTAISFRQALLELAPADAQFLPTLPAGHPKVNDRYRFQFIIKTSQILPLSQSILALRSSFRFPRKVTLHIDVDPISTFF